MNTETKTIAEVAAALDKHEKVCDERHHNINRRLDAIEQTISRLTWAMIAGMGTIIVMLGGGLITLFVQLVKIAAGGSL